MHSRPRLAPGRADEVERGMSLRQSRHRNVSVPPHADLNDATRALGVETPMERGVNALRGMGRGAPNRNRTGRDENERC